MGRISIGIKKMLSDPRTINVSDMTVTAYGLPSDARINPFICEPLGNVGYASNPRRGGRYVRNDRSRH